MVIVPCQAAEPNPRRGTDLGQAGLRGWFSAWVISQIQWCVTVTFGDGDHSTIPS